MTRRGAELAAALALAAAALVVWLAAPTFPNYDSYYHLVWGRELLDGVTPSFEAYAAPTKHPLYVAVAAVLGLVGEEADRALVGLCLLSHAALVFGVYRLGAATVGRWPGVAAAIFAGASALLLLYAARGYVDMPFLALVAWAAALYAERSRPVLPLILLIAAGLLRPEAWVLAGLLWLDAGRRPRLLALVAAAPALWVLVDLLATGDPLHSLHATTALADDLGREQGLAAVPGSLVSFLGAVVRPPVAVLGVAGLALALAVPERSVRELRIPLALLGAGVATFVATGVVGLSILQRYLTVPAVALCLFAGFALLGFASLPRDDARRRRWARASGAAAALGVAGLVALAPSPSRVTDELAFIRESHDALVALLDEPAVRRGLACGPLTFPNYRLVPDARWHLDLPAARVGARSARRRERGVAIFALGEKGLRRFGFADGTSPTTNVPDPGFERVAGNDRFAAYVACR